MVGGDGEVEGSVLGCGGEVEFLLVVAGLFKDNGAVWQELTYEWRRAGGN